MIPILLTAARRQAARTLGTAAAVVVAVAFVVATLVLSDTLARTLAAGVAAPYAGVDAVVAGDERARADGTALEAVTPAMVALVEAAPGVEAVAVDGLRLVAAPGSPQGFAGLAPLAADPVLRWQALTGGRWPAGSAEAVTASRVWDVGDEVRLVGSEDPGATGEETVLRVVGRVNAGAGVSADLLAAPATLDRVQPAAGWSRLLVVGEGGEDRVSAAVAAALDGLDPGDGSPGVEVVTGGRAVEVAVAGATGGRVELTLVVLVFGAVCVVVAALVIANTRTVVLAQRSRQLALLRCVGATRRQLAVAAIGEAALVGLVASLVGTVGGIGLAAAASALVATLDAPVPIAGLALRPGALVVGVVTGLVVTVAAAAHPAIRAARVAPVTALRPLEAAVSDGRWRGRRIVAGLLLAVPATAALIALVALAESGGSDTFMVAFALGVVSFLGVMVLAQPLAAGAVRALDRLVRGVLPPAAAVALANARRNPHRTGATVAALLIGVTLLVTATVGAATVRAGSLALLAADSQADVVVEAGEEALPAGLPAEVRRAPGVGDVLGLAWAAGEVVVGAGGAGIVGAPVPVRAVADPAQGEVLRSGDSMAPPRGTLRLGGADAEAVGLGDGDRVTLTGPGGEVTLRADVAPDDRGAPPGPLVAAADLRTLGGEPAADLLLVRLADGLDRGSRDDAIGAVDEVVRSAAPDAVVRTPVLEREETTAVLDGVLAVVAGLLGVSVVVAVVGVGTTLSLGVHERQQENGLLRALGMTAGQVRGVVVGEAVLLSLLATGLGVVLGAGYGAAGAAALLGADGFVFDLPVTRTAALVIATVAAGVVAAALPALRAGRVPPVAAMAQA
ncbi:MAG: FtsX-like permease family protein [Kineosporiaceae bacterium]